MAERRPLVLINGELVEIPSGDSFPSDIIPNSSTLLMHFDFDALDDYIQEDNVGVTPTISGDGLAIGTDGLIDNYIYGTSTYRGIALNQSVSFRTVNVVLKTQSAVEIRSVFGGNVGNNALIITVSGDSPLIQARCQAYTMNLGSGLAYDTWYMITLVLEDDDTVSCYVNGEYYDTGDVPDAATFFSVTDIGKKIGENYACSFIDDLRFYSDKMDATGVSDLYASIIPVEEPADIIQLDTSYAPTGDESQGSMYWNADEETVDIVQNGAILQVGQEIHVHVRNNTGVQINEGTVVMATGTIGASGRITVAPYDGTSDVKYVIGIATEDIADSEDGKVTSFGKVRGLDTTSWNEGDVLYTTTSGGLTSTEPTTGVKLPIAFVITDSATVGEIMVRVTPFDENSVDPILDKSGLAGQAVIINDTEDGYDTLNIVSNELPAYSTDEVLTSERWVDGKPIYKKTFSISLGNDTISKYDLGYVFADVYCIKAEGIAYNDTLKNYFVLPLAHAATTTGSVTLFFDDDIAGNATLNIETGQDRTGWSSGYATAYYTKTADTSNSPVASGSLSVGLSELPSYSVEEVLTSERWVDGKPIYKKTYIADPNSGVGNIDTIPNIIPVVDDWVYVASTTSYSKTVFQSESSSITGLNIYYNTTTSILSINQYGSLDDSSIGYTEFTIRYTKTTDNANSPVALVGGSKIEDFIIYGTSETPPAGTYVDGMVYFQIEE